MQLLPSVIRQLFTDSKNIKILLDRDEIPQLSRDPEKLEVVCGVADVSQDNFLLIQISHFKVLKQTILNISNDSVAFKIHQNKLNNQKLTVK